MIRELVSLTSARAHAFWNRFSMAAACLSLPCLGPSDAFLDRRTSERGYSRSMSRMGRVMGWSLAFSNDS